MNYLRNLFVKRNSNHLKEIFRYIGNKQPQNCKKPRKSFRTKTIIYSFATIGLTSVGIYEYYDIKKKRVGSESETKIDVVSNKKNDSNEPGGFRSALPMYTMDVVSSHNTKENRIWVVYKEGVYDVTDFVDEHPGGDNILIAAGASIEPFWMMYGIHKTPEIFKILEEMRIGNLSKEESQGAVSNMADYYINDPKRHPSLIPISLKPFNAEPIPSLLVENYITPNDIFYVRNHLPVPVVDPATYELEIEIEGKSKTVSLTLDQLKKFKKHTVTATIMCAGNRRSEMSKVKYVKGLNWGHGVVGNATWSGARLRDVLMSIGITDEDNFKHVQFEGLDVDISNNPYGGSISFLKAMNQLGDVILAYEMNGVEIPRDHGFPVRAIAPGIVGARNVKWLAKIVLSQEESPSFWQQQDYKGFNPSVEPNTADYTKAHSIQQLPVTSAICIPVNNSTVELKNGALLVKGYAWSGSGEQIFRVDVTIDGGQTWHVANIDHQGTEVPLRHWGWTLWSANIPVTPDSKKIEIWVKAVDSAFNTQPEHFDHIWNMRGFLSNAYHRVTVNIK